MKSSPRTPDDQPVPVAPNLASVSFVMPVLNEVDYLTAAIASIERQVFAGDSEIVLALGPSQDGTTELARRLAADNPRIRLVENPHTNISAGLNAAILASRYPVVIRVDAHTELCEGYVARALEILAKTGAANVGGVMYAEGKSRVQQAAARAYNSKLGLGGPAYHVGGEAGVAESAYLGVFRRDAALAVGLFDEDTKRGEDWEFNQRLKKAGFLVWFDPSLTVTYRPRGRYRDIARQFFATGMWRGELSRRSPRATSLRYLAPPVLTIAVGLSLIAAVITPLSTIPWFLWLIVAPCWVAVGAYAIVLIGSALGRSGGRSLRDKLATIAMLPTMHLSWGCGFLRGFFRGAGSADDTSRVSSATS